VIEADLGLIEAEAALAELEIFLCRPSEPSGADEPALETGWPAGT